MAEAQGWSWSPLARQEKGSTGACVAEKMEAPRQKPSGSRGASPCRGHWTEPLATAVRLADASRALTWLMSKRVEGERGSSPYPPAKTAAPRRKYFKEFNSHLLVGAGRQAPGQEKPGDSSHSLHPPSGLPAPPLGSTIILLEEKVAIR